MPNKDLPLEIQSDPMKDFAVGIAGMTIFAFFIPSGFSLALVFLRFAEPGGWAIDLAKFFGITVSQFSLVGSLIALPIGCLGLYSLYLIAIGKSQKTLANTKETT